MFDAETQASEGQTTVDSHRSSIDETWLTPQELADRWRIGTHTLANHRSAGDGLPAFKTPGGAVRYALSDVLAAEASGMSGGLSWTRLNKALKIVLPMHNVRHEQLMADLKTALKAA
jgi:hypothetical protein